MDNSAFLRIKFTPLLKKISSENIDSKCCIEIVPELSDTQNLDKIDWKADNDLVEYNIPMTYKIIIKKPNHLTNELQKKVYHSCVDLLPAYSMSDTNFASGDIKRIKSDNSLILNPSTCEKCDVMPMKTLMTNNQINKYKNKSTSVQALKTADAPSRPPGVDKCFDANLSNDIPLIKTNIRVTKSEETLKAEVDKYDNATTTCDLSNDSETDLAKKNSTGSLDAYIESFNEKHAQRKLSLSPICSVNTWDTLPAGPIYVTNNTSRFIFCKSDSLNKNMGYNPSHKNDSNTEKNKHMPYNSGSNQILRIYETKTNVTIQMVDDTSGAQNSKDGKMDKSVTSMPIYTSVKDITTSVSRITMTNFGKDNNFSQKHSHVSQNNFKIRNVNKSTDLSRNRKLTSNLNLEPVNVMFAKDKFNIINKNNITTTVCKIDSNQRPCQVRATPAIRVARFMKNIEEEIFPLRQMLYEIKSKCVGLGLLDLFCGEFMPSSQKSIIYRSVPDFEYIADESSSQQANTVKSNRVVYTILFNG